MASKNILDPDHPILQTSSDSKDLDFSPQDFSAQEISSIINAVPKLSFGSKGSFSNPLSIDQIIDELKLLDKRDERAKENMQPLQNLTKLDVKLVDNVLTL